MSNAKVKGKDIKNFKAKAKVKTFSPKPRPRTQNYFKDNFKDKLKSVLQLIS